MPSKSEKQKNFFKAVAGCKSGNKDACSDKTQKVANSMAMDKIKDYITETMNAKDIKKIQLYEYDHTSYGRNRLFNTKSMLQLVNGSTVLKNQYERLKEKGKEVFGYHFNEIILSFIFLKYIYKNKDLFDKYMVIRNRMIAKQNQDDVNGITEENDLNETDSSSSGQYSSPVAFAKNKENWKFGNAKNAGGENTQVLKGKFAIIEDDKTLSKKDKIDFINKNSNMYNNSQLELDNEQNLSDIYNQVKNKNVEGVPMVNEILSKEDMINYIGDNNNLHNREQMCNMSDDDVHTIYNQVKNKNFRGIPMNEDKKPSAIVNLEKLKADNTKNEKEYFNSLNSGIQKTIKNPEEGGIMDYKYDNDALKGDKIVKHNDNDKTKEWTELNRGRNAYDWDFDIEPTKDYIKRLKEAIGDERFKVFIEKIKLRQLERMHQKQAIVTTDPGSKGEYELNPSTFTLKEEKNMSENIITGKYKLLGDNKFVSFNPDTVKLVESVSKENIKLTTEGLGNTYNNKPLNECVSLDDDFLKYEFFITKGTNEIVKTKKIIMINESSINKTKSLINYNDKDGDLVSKNSNKGISWIF